MQINGARIIVETLIEQGTDTIFGYPGGQVIPIYDELYKCSDRINHVLTAHEQGAAHAADGYARATGKVGVVIATSGPGATNLVTGIATAMLDSVPMVAITGNVPNSLIGRDSFQEIDIVGVTMPITKHNFFVKNVSELAATIREAFRIAKSGRPGPVLVDIPKDVQSAITDYEPVPVVEKEPVNKAAQAQIDEAVAMISKAKKPYIYIGGGAVGAEIGRDVELLAEKFDCVIGSSMMGLGAVPTENPRFLGMEGMHGHYASSMAMNNCDLIFAVGVRFSDRATGNTKKFATKATIVQIDVDYAEINKNVVVGLGISADLADTFRRIAANLPETKHTEWMAEVQKYIDTENSRYVDDGTLTPWKAINIINDNISPETVIATDVGQHQMWAAQYCKFRKQRKFVSSGGLGTMGFGMGAAIGASMGTGCKTVLVTGDGSFGMNLNELATAVTQNVPLTIVILNNGVLGMVRQWQTLFYNKHYSNTVLNRKTDFVKLAEAFGAKGYKADTAEELEKAFIDAYNGGTPAVIDCTIDKDEFVLPMLPPGGSMDDMIVQK